MTDGEEHNLTIVTEEGLYQKLFIWRSFKEIHKLLKSNDVHDKVLIHTDV